MEFLLMMSHFLLAIKIYETQYFMTQIFKIAISFLCFRKKSLIERGLDNPVCQLFDEFPRLMLRNRHTSNFPEKNCGWLRNPAPPSRDG